MAAIFYLCYLFSIHHICKYPFSIYAEALSHLNKKEYIR